MTEILVSWIGQNDLNPSQGKGTLEGPILTGLRSIEFDKVYLLSNYPDKDTDRYVEWLREQIELEVIKQDVKLTSPIDHGAIYQTADSFLAEIIEKESNSSITIHLSPGTPAMAIESMSNSCDYLVRWGNNFRNSNQRIYFNHIRPEGDNTEQKNW